MKAKRVLSLFLILVILAGMFVLPTSAAESEITVLLDGEKLAFDVPPQLINNRTMVPMRKIFEAMGAKVDWDGTTKTVTAKKGDITVIMQIDNKVIDVNGEKISLDVPPQLVNSRTLVPARAVAESLNAKVDWDGDTRTVLITSEKATTTITPIDLSTQTDFVCNVGASITYGFVDMWNKTVGTDFVPYTICIDSAYKGQTLLMCPLYANFAVNDKGYSKVTFSIKTKNPEGKEEYLARDVVAIDGVAAQNQIIKSISDIEYWLEESDPLGTYTFTIESKDVIGNETTKNVFSVNFTEYKYEKNEFKSQSELLEFVANYSRNPNPDRIIDAIIYAEKNELTTYPIFFIGFVEMLAKNPYIAKEAITQFEKEFGEGGTEMLVLIDNTAAQYLESIRESDYPSFTTARAPGSVNGDIALYGAAIGVYFTTSSYDAAKVIVESLSSGEFSDAEMKEYGVLSVKNLVEIDPLFKAYCTYMLNSDTKIDSKTKSILRELLK